MDFKEDIKKILYGCYDIPSRDNYDIKAYIETTDETYLYLLARGDGKSVKPIDLTFGEWIKLRDYIDKMWEEKGWGHKKCKGIK